MGEGLINFDEDPTPASKRQVKFASVKFVDRNPYNLQNRLSIIPRIKSNRGKSIPDLLNARY